MANQPFKDFWFSIFNGKMAKRWSITTTATTIIVINIPTFFYEKFKHFQIAMYYRLSHPCCDVFR